MQVIGELILQPYSMDAKPWITDDELSILHSQDTSYTAFYDLQGIHSDAFTLCDLLNGNPNKALNTYIDGCIQQPSCNHPIYKTNLNKQNSSKRPAMHAARFPLHQSNRTGYTVSNQKHQSIP